MQLNIDVSQVTRSPKSTIVGLCVLALGAERGIHFDAAGHLAMNARDWLDLSCGVLTAIVSGLSRDGEREDCTSQGEAPEPQQQKEKESVIIERGEECRSI